MKVIIAGSRNIKLTLSELDVMVAESVLGISEVVSGNARGIDQLGEAYAHKHDIDLTIMPPNWGKHGKRAGYLRNLRMGEYADTLLAVWNGTSKGTKHMIDIMQKLNKPYHIHLTKV